MANRPFSMRNRGEKWTEYDGPHDGVPTWLRDSLLPWTMERFQADGGVYGLQFDFNSVLEFGLHVRRSMPDNERDFGMQLWASPELLLDAVHFALQRIEADDGYYHHEIDQLSLMLARAGSAYTVGVDAGDRYELQDRLTPEATAAGQAAMAPKDRTAEHLRAAWSKAFGRNGDADGAYLAAVKAVEVAARPVVTPNDATATLGKMIQAMKDKPTKWTTTIDWDHDVASVVSMMELVWKGQYRHGDETKPASHSTDTAQAVVLVTVTLVQWFRSSFVNQVS